jgi:hypothetical protein
VNKEQSCLLMGCLIESRQLYNEMLSSMKQHYEQNGTFPSKYDLNKQFTGRGGKYVPESVVQCLSDRLSKALKRFLAAHALGQASVGFPRFKQPDRWHSIQLRQYGDQKNRRDVLLAPDGKHLFIPKKLGGSLKIKLHRPTLGRGTAFRDGLRWESGRTEKPPAVAVGSCHSTKYTFRNAKKSQIGSVQAIVSTMLRRIW